MPKSFLLRRHLKQEWNSKEEVLPMSGSLHLDLWGGLPSETNNLQKPDFKGQKIVEGRAENKAFMLDNNANTLKYPDTEHSHFEDVTSNQSLREFGEEKDSPKDGAFSKVAEYSKARARLGSNGKISKRQQTSVDQETRQPREAASKKIGSSCPTPSGKQPYKCNQCGKIFKTKYTLTIHLKMPSHTGARPFVCGICGKGFRLSSTLCRHKIIHTSDKPHKCHICEKAFNRSSTLKTHIRTHSELKEFLCDICGKGFHQKGNLRNHVLIHTGEKPYRCSLCDKAFNKLSNLKFHMHIHTDNAPYRCRYCKTCFTRRCDLKLHISDCHRRK